MRELSNQEVAQVSGGLSLNAGMGLIEGIVGVCAAVGVAPAAVAFGAGVILARALAEAMD